VSDGDVAREVRRHVVEAGGSRWVPVRWLRDAFGRGALTLKARAEMAAALSEVGVEADPDLDHVELDDDVRLYLSERARMPDRAEVAPPPAAPPPPPPGPWQRFRRWPAWAQLATAAAVLILIIGIAAGDDSGDDGRDPDPQPAQQAEQPESDDDSDAARREAKERERARERRRERVRQKRERARQRARERRRERERREARERERERERRRREREATPDPEPEAACEPGYSPCVPPYPPDLDCPDLGGPYAVTGSDPHRLDADGDGEGCE
jgi:hypothetical protein